MAYFFAVLFYCLGYIIVAASRTVGEVAGGEVLFTIGNTAISLSTSSLISALTLPLLLPLGIVPSRCPPFAHHPACPRSRPC